MPVVPDEGVDFDESDLSQAKQAVGIGFAQLVFGGEGQLGDVLQRVIESGVTPASSSFLR